MATLADNPFAALTTVVAPAILTNASLAVRNLEDEAQMARSAAPR
jgi:hypothetical protein